MVYKRVILGIDGTDPRNCAEIAKQVCRFESTIVMEYDGKTVSMKSLIGLISMGLTKKAEVVIRAEGKDAQEAVDAVAKFIG